MNFYRFEERDVFMSKRYLSELKSKLPPGDLKLPQMFLNDQLVGVSLIMLLLLLINNLMQSVEVVEKLNEVGDLKEILKDYRVSLTLFTQYQVYFLE